MPNHSSAAFASLRDACCELNSRLTVRNVVRYFPVEIHSVLGPEFASELRSEGHIYMRRFRPTEYEMLAYPIQCYPAALPHAPFS